MAAFERARELAEQIGEPSLLVPAMYGLWANRYISGSSGRRSWPRVLRS